MASILKIVDKGYPKYLSAINLPYLGGLLICNFIRYYVGIKKLISYKTI